MRKAGLPERRKNPRREMAVRVVLRDHRPPMHAMTRNLSLGGMYLMTATRKLHDGNTLVAEIEIDRRGQRWSAPLPVNLIWFDHMNAGVSFARLSPEATNMLSQLLDDGISLPARRRHQRQRV